jgi:hypothetical protein
MLFFQQGSLLSSSMYGRNVIETTTTSETSDLDFVVRWSCEKNVDDPQ